MERNKKKVIEINIKKDRDSKDYISKIDFKELLNDLGDGQIESIENFLKKEMKNMLKCIDVDLASLLKMATTKSVMAAIYNEDDGENIDFKNIYNFQNDIDSIAKDIMKQNYNKFDTISEKYGCSKSDAMIAVYARLASRICKANDSGNSCDCDKCKADREKAKKLQDIEKLKGSIPDEFYKDLMDKYNNEQ